MTAFIVLVSRVILAFDLNLYVPISRLDENMRNAHKIDACLQQKFWFPVTLLSADMAGQRTCRQMEQMTIAEIFLGNDKEVGLITLCHLYLDFIGCDAPTRKKLETYLNFICMRATGKVLTPARWIREFVMKHPDYKQDSRVPPSAAYDLVRSTTRIAQGLEPCPELLGPNVIEPLLSAACTGLRSCGSMVGEHPAPEPVFPPSDFQKARSAFILQRFRERTAHDKEAALEAEVMQMRAAVQNQAQQLEKLEKQLAAVKMRSGTVTPQPSKGSSAWCDERSGA